MAKPLAPCGTRGAYRRHLRWGQPPCNACRAEHARLTQLERERARKPRALTPCGSDSSYRRHLRLGEVPCRACVDAHADAVRTWMRRHRAAA